MAKESVINVRVDERLIKKLAERVNTINKADKLGRKLTRSTLVRFIIEQQLEEQNDE